MQIGRGLGVRLEAVEDRPPFRKRAPNPIIEKLESISKEWKLPLGTDLSLVSSAAGLIPTEIPVVCGLAPAGRDLLTRRLADLRGKVLQALRRTL